MGRIAVAARRRGGQVPAYERIIVGLRELGPDRLDTLPADRHLVERYFGLHGTPTASLRMLAGDTGLPQREVLRRVYRCVVVLLGPAELSRPCVVCGRPFVPPDPWSRRRTCGRQCETDYHRQLGAPERFRAAARRQGRDAAEHLRVLDRRVFDRLPDRAGDVVRLYHGLDDGRPRTKRELAEHFGLTVSRVDHILRTAVPWLLDPATAPLLSPEDQRRRRSAAIAATRRRHGRPAAEALRALGSTAFDVLPGRERELVRRYYGLAGC